MRHVLHECGGECNGCCICEGGLALCDVCGGAEGSMPTDCPGKKMTGDEQDAVYFGTLDFVGGTWIDRTTPPNHGD